MLLLAAVLNEGTGLGIGRQRGQALDRESAPVSSLVAEAVRVLPLRRGKVRKDWLSILWARWRCRLGHASLCRETDVSDHEIHQIGTVADAVGLSLRTIRHYEDVGLVVPSGRSPGGFRLYTDHDVERLRLVTRMKSLGFSLVEIGDVLELLDGLDEMSGHEAAHVRGDRLDMYATLAAERCERLREQLAAASEFTDKLSKAARSARRVTAPQPR